MIPSNTVEYLNTNVEAKLLADDAGPTTVGNGATIYPKASFVSNKDIDQHAWYDYLVNGTMDYTNNVEPIVGHASFDDNITIKGTKGFDHHHSYQAYTHYNCTGTLGHFSSFWSQPDATAGTINSLTNFEANDALGSGTIQNQYGFYCGELTRGANNFAFYSASNITQSFFGGGTSYGRNGVPYATIKYNSNGNLDIIPRAGYMVDVKGPASFSTIFTDQLLLYPTSVAPATPSSPGTPGEMRNTPNFLYVCIAANTWRRTALLPW